MVEATVATAARLKFANGPTLNAAHRCPSATPPSLRKFTAQAASTAATSLVWSQSRASLPPSQSRHPVPPHPPDPATASLPGALAQPPSPLAAQLIATTLLSSPPLLPLPLTPLPATPPPSSPTPPSAPSTPLLAPLSLPATLASATTPVRASVFGAPDHRPLHAAPLAPSSTSLPATAPTSLPSAQSLLLLPSSSAPSSSSSSSSLLSSSSSSSSSSLSSLSSPSLLSEHNCSSAAVSSAWFSSPAQSSSSSSLSSSLSSLSATAPSTARSPESTSTRPSVQLAPPSQPLYGPTATTAAATTVTTTAAAAGRSTAIVAAECAPATAKCADADYDGCSNRAVRRRIYKKIIMQNRYYRQFYTTVHRLHVHRDRATWDQFVRDYWQVEPKQLLEAWNWQNLSQQQIILLRAHPVNCVPSFLSAWALIVWESYVVTTPMSKRSPFISVCLFCCIQLVRKHSISSIHKLTNLEVMSGDVIVRAVFANEQAWCRMCSNAALFSMFQYAQNGGPTSAATQPDGGADTTTLGAEEALLQRPVEQTWRTQVRSDMASAPRSTTSPSSSTGHATSVIVGHLGPQPPPPEQPYQQHDATQYQRQFLLYHHQQQQQQEEQHQQMQQSQPQPYQQPLQQPLQQQQPYWPLQPSLAHAEHPYDQSSAPCQLYAEPALLQCQPFEQSPHHLPFAAHHNTQPLQALAATAAAPPHTPHHLGGAEL